MTARVFHLQRDVDVTGVSGSGLVAEGVQFTDGTVVLRWCSSRPSTVIYGTLADVKRVHGHGGKTRVVWEDEDA